MNRDAKKVVTSLLSFWCSNWTHKKKNHPPTAENCVRQTFYLWIGTPKRCEVLVWLSFWFSNSTHKKKYQLPRKTVCQISESGESGHRKGCKSLVDVQYWLKRKKSPTYRGRPCASDFLTGESRRRKVVSPSLTEFLVFNSTQKIKKSPNYRGKLYASDFLASESRRRKSWKS